MPKRTCSVEGCGRSAVARSLCGKHYQKWKNDGADPAAAPRVTHSLVWPETLTRRMEPQPNGCIHYTGPLNWAGYGVVCIPQRVRATGAHRAAYIYFVGPIPEGMQVDHECHNHADPPCNEGIGCLHRRCVNPEHLILRTPRDNVNASPNTNGLKTHCIRGHEFTPENTYIFPNEGWRRCRKCSADRAAGRHTEPVVPAS